MRVVDGVIYDGRPGRVGRGMRPIAIVGASLAGLRSAEALRTNGFDGRLSVVGAEAPPPLRPAAAVQGLPAGQGRPARPGARRGRRRRRTGGRMAAGCAGGTTGPASGRRRAVRRLGADRRRRGHRDRRHAPDTARHQGHRRGATPCAPVEDAIALRASTCWPKPAHVVVVGAGFLGAEVAASCARARALGDGVGGAATCRWRRSSGRRWAARAGQLHTDNGVDADHRARRRRAGRPAPNRAGAGCAGVPGQRARAASGPGGRGDRHAAGNSDWLAGSGCRSNNGVLTDAGWLYRDAGRGRGRRRGQARTRAGRRRHEHWTNASEQPRVAARTCWPGSTPRTARAAATSGPTSTGCASSSPDRSRRPTMCGSSRATRPTGRSWPAITGTADHRGAGDEHGQGVQPGATHARHSPRRAHVRAVHRGQVAGIGVRQTRADVINPVRSEPDRAPSRTVTAEDARGRDRRPRGPRSTKARGRARRHRPNAPRCSTGSRTCWSGTRRRSPAPRRWTPANRWWRARSTSTTWPRSSATTPTSAPA